MRQVIANPGDDDILAPNWSCKGRMVNGYTTKWSNKWVRPPYNILFPV